MGLPIVLIIILIGRGASLPNAWDGIRLYIGTWHTSKLSAGQIWTAALGQVFFSTGVGFGYFTAYASYQSKFANAVQDSLIICLSNSAFEVFAAFAVFGVIGFLGLVSLQEHKHARFSTVVLYLRTLHPTHTIPHQNLLETEILTLSFYLRYILVRNYMEARKSQRTMLEPALTTAC
jgi:SNF family Na+-dependent transporter